MLQVNQNSKPKYEVAMYKSYKPGIFLYNVIMVAMIKLFSDYIDLPLKSNCSYKIIYVAAGKVIVASPWSQKELLYNITVQHVQTDILNTLYIYSPE